MKFGFYASGKATRVIKMLKFINQNKQFTKLLDEISFIFVDNILTNTELEEIAKQSKIKVFRKDLSNVLKEEKGIIVSSELFDLLKKTKTNILFVYGERLLKGQLIKEYKNKIINFHPAVLPAFPGFRAIDQAIDYASLIFGNTAHYIDEGVDTGAIIMQNILTREEYSSVENVLDNQVLMQIQIMLWLIEDRIKMEGRKVVVEKASYRLNNFVPSLELELVKI